MRDKKIVMNEIDFKKQLQKLLDKDRHNREESKVNEFHPSTLCNCERQIYLRKMNLTSIPDRVKGILMTGTLIHKYLENLEVDGLKEVPMKKKFGDILLNGKADLVTDTTVYDYKTRGSWFRYNPPREEHRNQLTLYMAMFGKKRSQIVYVNKQDLTIRLWPTVEWYPFSQSRFTMLLERAETVRDAILEVGKVNRPEDIPFEKCGCFLCENERLDKDAFEVEEKSEEVE